jgi:hypothetical protein
VIPDLRGFGSQKPPLHWEPGRWQAPATSSLYVDLGCDVFDDETLAGRDSIGSARRADAVLSGWAGSRCDDADAIAGRVISVPNEYRIADRNGLPGGASVTMEPPERATVGVPTSVTEGVLVTSRFVFHGHLT